MNNWIEVMGLMEGIATTVILRHAQGGFIILTGERFVEKVGIDQALRMMRRYSELNVSDMAAKAFWRRLQTYHGDGLL